MPNCGNDDRALVLRNMRPTSRAAIGAGLHPELREKLPLIPNDRDDLAFTPIMCELVPYPTDAESVG